MNEETPMPYSATLIDGRTCRHMLATVEDAIAWIDANGAEGAVFLGDDIVGTANQLREDAYDRGEKEVMRYPKT